MRRVSRVVVPVDVRGAAMLVRVGVAGENGHSAPQRGVERIVRRLVAIVMMVSVVMAVRPVSILDELDLVAVIVRAVAENQINLEAVRLRYLLQRFPKASPVSKGELLARAILADGFGVDPIDGGTAEAEAWRHPLLED